MWHSPIISSSYFFFWEQISWKNLSSKSPELPSNGPAPDRVPWISPLSPYFYWNWLRSFWSLFSHFIWKMLRTWCSDFLQLYYLCPFICYCQTQGVSLDIALSVGHWSVRPPVCQDNYWTKHMCNSQQTGKPCAGWDYVSQFFIWTQCLHRGNLHDREGA